MSFNDKIESQENGNASPARTFRQNEVGKEVKKVA